MPQRRTRHACIGALSLVLLVADVAPGGAQAAEPLPESTTSTTAAPTTTSTTQPPTTSTTAPGVDPTTTAPPEESTTTTLPEGPETETPAPNGLSPEQQATLKELANEYDDVAADELDFFNRLLGSQALVGNLNLEIANLDLGISTVEADVAEAQAAVDASDADVAEVEASLAATADELDEANVTLRNWAVRAYIAGGAEPPPAALLGLDNATDLAMSVTYADAVALDANRSIAKVRRLREAQQVLIVELRAQQAAAVGARDLVALREGDLQRQRGQQVQARTTVETAMFEQQGLLIESAERRAEYERRQVAANQVSDGIAETLATAQADQLPPILTTAIFLPPVKGARIVSAFGSRIHPVYGVARMHNGVDFDAPTGAPIRAVGDGVVVIAGERGGYGNCIVIDHGNGIGTLYGHQSALVATVGQQVRQGDVIGAVGSTGLSTGPHLHFEVRLKGQPVNPLPYIGPDR